MLGLTYMATAEMMNKHAPYGRVPNTAPTSAGGAELTPPKKLEGGAGAATGSSGDPAAQIPNPSRVGLFTGKGSTTYGSCDSAPGSQNVVLAAPPQTDGTLTYSKL
jgi:hypothetical protein